MTELPGLFFSLDLEEGMTAADSNDDFSEGAGQKKSRAPGAIPARPDAVDWNEKTQVSMIREADPVEDLFDTLQRAQRPTGAVPKSPEEFADDMTPSRPSSWQAIQFWIRSKPVLFGLFVVVLLNGVAWGLYMWARPDGTVPKGGVLVKDAPGGTSGATGAPNPSEERLETDDNRPSFGSQPARTVPQHSGVVRSSTPSLSPPANRTEQEDSTSRSNPAQATTERVSPPPQRPSKIREPDPENVEYDPVLPRGGNPEGMPEEVPPPEDPDNPFGD